MKKMNRIGSRREWGGVKGVLVLLLLSLPFSLAAQTDDDLILENQYKFKLCDGNPNGQTLVVYNNSVHPELANGVFYVEWGDGSEKEEWGSGNNKSHYYVEWGEFELIFSWESIDGSKKLKQPYTVIRLPQPSAALVVENTGVCKGANSKIEIIQYDIQDKSTQYELNMGGEEMLTLSQKDVEDKKGIVEHVFDTEDCPIVVTLSVTNACAEFMAPVVSTRQMALFVKPEADFTIPEFNCAGHPLIITNKTKGGKDLQCNDNTYYVWQFEGQSVAFFEKEPTVIYDVPGKYEVMLIANTGQSECSADTLRDTIVVTPTPQINFSVDYDTICSEEIVQFRNLSQGAENPTDNDRLFTYAWDIWDPVSGAVKSFDYVDGSGNNPNSKIRFNDYGVYHVTLRAENIKCQCVCDEECKKERSKDTIIIVKKSPIVDTLDLDSIICPDDNDFKILDFSKDNLVLYEWNGNIEGGVTWTIQSKEEGKGSVEYVDGTAPTSIYPKVKLGKGATYIFRVKVAPVSVNNHFCSQPSEKEKEVKIPNTVIQAEFFPEPTGEPLKFCSGELVEIENRSKGENITYSWEYDKKNGHEGESNGVPNLTEKTFSAVFNYGVYKVTGFMKVGGKCPVKINGIDRVEYEVQIGKRPEIGDVKMPMDSALCAGESIEFVKNLIDYKFYDSPSKVKWTFDPELPAGAYKEGNESSPWPRIEFSKPNQIYAYTIEMPEDWVNECEEQDGKYIYKGTITVHNDQLNRVVQQVGGIKIPDKICINEELVLQNIEGDGMQPDESTSIMEYKWYAINAQKEETDSCQLSEQDSPDKVEVKFLNVGKYGIVSDVTDSYCGTKASDTVWFVVKKTPEILFDPNPLQAIPGTIRMEDWVRIDWFNNDLSQPIDWKVEGDREINKQTLGIDPMPEFPIEDAGDYMVSVTLPNAECSMSGVKQQAEIHIIDTAIKNTESIRPDYKEFCVGEKVTFVNNATAERPLKWFWEVQDAKSGYTFENGGLTSEEKTPSITFSEPGEYTMHLTINEGANSKELFFKLTVYGLPDLNLTDMEKCETSILSGEEIKSKIVLNNNELLGAQWSVTPQGYGKYFFQEGNNQTLYPTFAFKPDENTGYCNYVVSVEYTTHCREPNQAEFQVHVDEQVKIESLEDDYVCIWSDAKELQAVPDTGIWSTKDQALLNNIYSKDNIFYFDPIFSTNENKDVELIYTIKNGLCISEAVKKIYVHALPFVDAGNDLQMCLNDQPLALIGRDSVVGGHWTENQGKWKWSNIEWDDYHFDIQKLPYPPSSESYKLLYEYTYQYTDHNLSCSNTDTIELFVRALPETHFDISAPIVSGDTLCINKEVRFIPNDALGNIFEWHFDWLNEPDSKEISQEKSVLHTYTDYGDYGVKCMVSRLYNNTISELVCRDTSDIKKITVLQEPPVVYFDVNQTANCAPLEITVSVDKNVYSLDYADFTYTWDFGNGKRVVSQELIEKISQTYQSAVRDTTYKISWEVSNRCNVGKYEKEITVYSVPQVGLTLKRKEACAPVEVEVNNTTTGDKCEFSWTISNNQNLDTIRDLPLTRDLKYFFDRIETTTVYRINLHARNRCAEVDTAIELVIKPQTVKADFTVLEELIACAREELFFRNNSIDTVAYIEKTQWNLGDGFISDNWEVYHAYDEAGTYEVVLTVDNGCSVVSDTQQVYINPLPKLSIFSQDTLCEEDEFHFSFEADMDLSLYEWRLQDTLVKRDSFDYVFEGYGEFPVTLIGTSMTFTRCQDSVIKTVVVNNKPIMTILPLDTAVCSPLNYVPFVEGEHETLLWDYGDGTELTSAPEHVYENRGDSAYRYVVTAFVTTDKGCSSEYERGVTVYNRPTALLNKEVGSGRPQRVTFLNLSEGANAGHWILPLRGEIYSADNQTEEFMENGFYPVTLIASNRYGCSDTITLEHEVSMHGLYFPNTFIPHSLNAKINLFNGVGMGLQSYHLEILDQYGNVLWATDALEDGKPVGGWNGTNRKGERMPQGVYIWRAKAIFGSDDVWTGDNNDSGIPEYTQGTVLLLRE